MKLLSVVAAIKDDVYLKTSPESQLTCYQVKSPQVKVKNGLLRQLILLLRRSHQRHRRFVLSIRRPRQHRRFFGFLRRPHQQSKRPLFF